MVGAVAGESTVISAIEIAMRRIRGTSGAVKSGSFRSRESIGPSAHAARAAREAAGGGELTDSA